MPKKVSATDQKQWLLQYEGGKSEASIAKATHHDLRTIKKGIEAARRERDAAMARADLVKVALHRHQASLISVVEAIQAALQAPQKDGAVVPWDWEADSTTIYAQLWDAQEKNEEAYRSAYFDFERTPEYELLQEHLKRDRLWKVLAEWKIAYLQHLEQRIALQRRTVNLLETGTGCKLVAGAVVVDPPFLNVYNAGDLFFRVALGQALRPEYKADMEDGIITDIARGEVRCRGLTLASAPGHEDETRRKLLVVFDRLQASEEAKRVAETYEAVPDSITRAGRAIQEILLLGLIPGQCRVCRRLGM